MKKVINMPRYSVYKDSGVDWLGYIPEHWKILRFNFVFCFSKGLNITKENLQDNGIPCVNYGEIHSKYGFEIDQKKHQLKCVSDEYLKANKKSLLSYGDFVFADTSEDIEGAGNFSYLNNAKDTVFAGYHTVITRPIVDVNIRFLAYMLDSESYRSQIRNKVKGVKVYSVTKTILKDTNICLPSDTEQIAIANFLDKKTIQIDQAISIKQKQIELLKERQQIIIQQAVTKGLDPNVPMKDSGIEWIGMIPEHWKISKLKYLLDEINIRTATGSEELLSLSKYQGVIPKSSLAERAGYAESLVGYKIVKKGCLVINKMQAVNGLLAVSNFNGITSPDYSVYKEKNSNIININFLCHLLLCPEFLAEFKKRVTGVMDGFIRLYTADLYSISIFFPEKEEQSTIVDYIEQKMKKYNNLIDIETQQIEKLKEYKTTLIDSAVTGKIKITPEE